MVAATQWHKTRTKHGEQQNRKKRNHDWRFSLWNLDLGVSLVLGFWNFLPHRRTSARIGELRFFPFTLPVRHSLDDGGKLDHLKLETPPHIGGQRRTATNIG
jgi:hypothetical protein